jgi:hypothetical protein
MLPDLRVVIAAVVSTFLLTVGVGFLASSRLIHEQMTARVDPKGLDDTPINRIALNWPEPTKVERHVDLDFAISAKGSGNPVRDITPQVGQTPPPAASVPSPVAAAPATASDVTASVPEVETIRAPEPAVPVVNAPEPTQAQTPAEDSPASAAFPAPPVFSEPATLAEESAITKTATLTETAAPPEPVPPAEVTAPQEMATVPQATATEPATETRVVVYPDPPATPEATGSIAASIPSDTPAIPLPESRPKFAARPEAERAEPATRPALTVPARAPAIAKRRPRQTTHRQRQVTHNQPAQPQQIQPFDFFGLFRAPSATQRLPAQVAKPTTPIN